MGQKQLNASLSCNKCYNHYIIEIITNKNNFLIRRFVIVEKQLQM